MKCDWCGSSKKVSRTQYGTSKFIRFICNDCKERFIKEIMLTDGLTREQAKGRFVVQEGN